MARHVTTLLGLAVTACSPEQMFVEVPADIDRVAVLSLANDSTDINMSNLRSTTPLKRVGEDAFVVELSTELAFVVGYRTEQLTDRDPLVLNTEPIRIGTEDLEDAPLPAPAWAVRVDADGPVDFERSIPALDVWRSMRNRGGWAPLEFETKPSARYRHGVTYDPVRERVVLFGGDDDAPGRFDDTWEFTDTWRVVTTTVSPPPRSLGTLAFDPVTERVILFGGYEDVAGAYGDTWAFDGTWTRLRPPSRPGKRSGHRMVLDEKRGRIVLFGGVAGSTQNDTWIFDGETWTELSLATAPPVRRDFGMVYHPERETVVIVGGVNEERQILYPDAWELTEDGWQTVPELALPFPRRGLAIAWSPRLRRLVLHGGWNDQTTYAETLLHDGTRWVAAPVDVELSPRRRHAFVFVPALDAVMSVGGETGLTAPLDEIATFEFDRP